MTLIETWYRWKAKTIQTILINTTDTRSYPSASKTERCHIPFKERKKDQEEALSTLQIHTCTNMNMRLVFLALMCLITPGSKAQRGMYRNINFYLGTGKNTFNTKVTLAFRLPLRNLNFPVNC